MQIHLDIPLIDDTLGNWRVEVGRDLIGFRYHVYRLVNFTYAMGEFDEEVARAPHEAERDKDRPIEAGAHDAGTISMRVHIPRSGGIGVQRG